MKSNNPYKTEKLVFSAFLIASGKAELVSVEPIPGSHNVIFVLSQAPSQEIITGFFSGASQISALRYSEAITMLKGVSHEAKRTFKQDGM